MKLSTKQILIVSILLVVATLVGYAFLLMDIKNKNQKASALFAEIDQYAEHQAELRVMDKFAEKLRGDIEKIDSYFVHKDDVVSFIEVLEGAGARVGADVSIGSITLEEAPADAPDTAEKLFVRVDAKGSWSAVTAFLSSVEHMPYRMFIDRVAVERNAPPAPFFASTEAPATEKGAWSVVFDMRVLTTN